MKKILTLILCAMLVLAPCTSVYAGAPAPGSLAAKYQSIRGNGSFTPESYPEVWITPIFGEHIISGTNPEKYPPHFLRFAPPEGAAVLSFTYDKAVFVDHDKLMIYDYFAYDRASFELFLEKAEAEHILADGSDGVAIYVQPDSRRARAMIDLEPQFGGTAKLEIILDDYSRDITSEQLGEMIQAEVKRVQETMQLETLDHYWSEGVFASIELHADSDPVSAAVDTTNLTVTRLEGKKLIAQSFDGKNVNELEIALDNYSYPHGDESATDEKLADGTPYKRYSSDYISYASFTLLEEGKYGPVYLTIKIDTTPEAFPELLEQAYDLVKVTEE